MRLSAVCQHLCPCPRPRSISFRITSNESQIRVRGLNIFHVYVHVCDSEKLKIVNLDMNFDRNIKTKKSRLFRFVWYVMGCIFIFMANGFYKLKSEKIRLPGSPPPADSLSLLIPDWPIFWIVNFVDLYWPIRHRKRVSRRRRTRQSYFFRF